MQSRWKIEKGRAIYYGLRNKEHLFQNEIKISERQKAILLSLPKELGKREKAVLGKHLLGVVAVEEKDFRPVPKSLSDAHFCSSCAANDFMIPGLEFDAEGRCPVCQCRKETEGLRSLVPVMNDFPHAKNSRFDVAVFYTGGKDSTYLLYYLSKVKGLRVLALTWEIPFMSKSAFLSIEGLLTCVPAGCGYCKACFTGEYPVEIPRSFWEDRFLPGFEPRNLTPASATSQMPIEDAESVLMGDK